MGNNPAGKKVKNPLKVHARGERRVIDEIPKMLRESITSYIAPHHFSCVRGAVSSTYFSYMIPFVND